MKKKILFYQWKSAFHAHLEQTKELVPESSKGVIENLLNDIHTQVDFIGLGEVEESFLDNLFKPKNNAR